MSLTISQAALHALLNDAHTALADHRFQVAETLLHALRRVTAPEPRAFSGSPMADAGLITPMIANTHIEKAAAAAEDARTTRATTVHARPLAPEAGTPAPPTCIPGKWSPDRLALLRAEFPSCIDRPGLLARVNALPGEPIASVGAMRHKAHALGIAAPPHIARAIQADAGQRGGRNTEATTPTKPSEVRTDERFAAFPALWTDASLSVADIQARLNAMPGKPLLTSTQLYGWAKKAGLATQRVLPADLPDAPAAQPKAEAAPPDPKAEAFDAFDAGQTVRAVAEDFGLPLSTLSNWQAEWKLARRKDVAA